MVTGDALRLRKQLKSAGLSDAVVNAAWPDWWSDEAERTASGRAELRFALARRLGLSPRALIGEAVEFLWVNEARFKNLAAKDVEKQAALASFGMTIARLLIEATPPVTSLVGTTARSLRDAILASRSFVDLEGLIATCWGIGVPVIHLRVFPLETKSMHAMVVRVGDRFAILLGRDAQYPAPIAFALAHEIGHICENHVEASSAIVDMDEDVGESDDQEGQADRFALELLTGTTDPVIEANLDTFTAKALAAAVLKAGPLHRIEPGALALCFAYRKGCWPVAVAAMKTIYAQPSPVWSQVNRFADLQLNWEAIGDESGHYLRRIMGAGD